jgi:hypothetical protein
MANSRVDLPRHDIELLNQEALFQAIAVMRRGPILAYFAFANAARGVELQIVLPGGDDFCESIQPERAA